MIIPKYQVIKFKKEIGSYRIRRAIRKYRDNYRVIVGAGETSYAGWISTDYPALDITDPDSISKYFIRESVKIFLAEHVFEHLTLKQAESALFLFKGYLVKGGYFRIAVPDGFHPDPNYINQVRPGGSGAGSDDHKVLYNYKTITELIEKAGFKVKLLEWYDHDGKFHLVDWQPETGMIRRSFRFDQRKSDNKLNYTSLIVDAIKP
jgi:predicted SAM-dependent methyltransferase